jgi:hypothetical protein
MQPQQEQLLLQTETTPEVRQRASQTVTTRAVLLRAVRTAKKPVRAR